MEERSMRKKPVVLMILDGYGLNDKVEGNAVAQANTPVMDSLMKEYPFVHCNSCNNSARPTSVSTKLRSATCVISNCS